MCMGLVEYCLLVVLVEGKESNVNWRCKGKECFSKPVKAKDGIGLEIIVGKEYTHSYSYIYVELMGGYAGNGLLGPHI